MCTESASKANGTSFVSCHTSLYQETALEVAYKTKLGSCYHTTIEAALKTRKFKALRGKVSLIFTSPPFPLNRKKKYGNLNGAEYSEWLSALAPQFGNLLTHDGSIVMELGNSWVQGSPTMSTLSIEALLAFLKAGKFHLCQQFIWNNPARLPSPAQWVNVRRTRVKDAFTTIWWMSRSENPKANNRNVLLEYSKSMKELLSAGKYNSGRRPSEHKIGSKSFLEDNGGSIPSNVLTVANTSSNSPYQNYCKLNGLVPHPARMPDALPEFFIKFLTDENDIVLDPFAGSNTTGAIAETNNRRWFAIEAQENYIQGSLGRFNSSVL